MPFYRFSLVARFGFAALGCGVCILPAGAQTVVSPGGAAATEGNTNNAFPFNYTHSGRYQQVYAASEFSAATGPTLITQIAFRPDAASGGAFSTTFANVQFDLSTTSKQPNFLSANFASNVGADDRMVRSGSLTLSSAFTGPAAGPKDFDVIVTLTTPFVYDPAAGNLLLDIRKFSAEGIGQQLDAVDGSGVSSRAYSYDVNDANGLIGAFYGEQTALVTQFTFSGAAVPEPGNLAPLFGVGVTGAGIFLRRKKK